MRAALVRAANACSNLECSSVGLPGSISAGTLTDPTTSPSRCLRSRPHYAYDSHKLHKLTFNAKPSSSSFPLLLP
ncbi:hypothetical protein MTP99_014470 [Tenebrio molitor]|nr:hypothetical protein MTP99_014470 [Tenebrio molitor]